jgi:hypothetical protein
VPLDSRQIQGEIMQSDRVKPRQETLDKYVGRRFERMAITSFSHYSNGMAYYSFACDCGKTGRIRSSRIGVTKSCGCFIRDFRRTGHEDISGTYWSGVVSGAKEQDCELSITKEFVWDLYLKQNQRCYFSGVEVEFSSVCREEQTASVVRMDKRLGYTETNIVIVHKTVGRMYLRMPLEQFLFLVNAISENNACQK